MGGVCSGPSATMTETPVVPIGGTLSDERLHAERVPAAAPAEVASAPVAQGEPPITPSEPPTPSRFERMQVSQEQMVLVNNVYVRAGTPHSEDPSSPPHNTLEVPPSPSVEPAPSSTPATETPVVNGRASVDTSTRLLPSSSSMREEKKPRELSAADRLFFEGNFHAYHGELQEAVETFTMALSLRAKFPKALYQRGHVLLELGKLNDALEDFTAAVGMGYTLALIGRGKAKLLQHNLTAAVEDLTESITLRPDYAVAYHLRSAAYEQMHDKEKAKADLQRVDILDNLQKVCVVCMDSRRVTRLSPCQHAAMCGLCADECLSATGKCPLCGTAIDNIEYGFFVHTFTPSQSLGTEFSSGSVAKDLVALARKAEELGPGADPSDMMPSPSTPSHPRASPSLPVPAPIPHSRLSASATRLAPLRDLPQPLRPLVFDSNGRLSQGRPETSQRLEPPNEALENGSHRPTP